MNTITHPVAPEEIMAFLDGELSADRAQSLSAHLEQCSECQQIIESFRFSSQKMAAWVVTGPQWLDESDFVSSTERVASKEKARAGFRGLRDLVSPKWVWAPALTLVFTIIAFAVVLPDLSVRHKPVVAPSSAVMLQRVEPLDLKPYISGRGDVDGGGGAGLDKLVVQPGYTKIPAAGISFVTPMIARTDTLSIVVKEFDAARGSLDAILARHNGYASTLNVGTPQGAGRTIQASLRIPAPQLVATISELKVLGRVEAEAQNGEEVTQQHADLLARLKNSRETEQRLQDVLRTRTGKVKDVLEVEQEIARVRGEIEQMEAERQTLEHRVNFATIDLKLAEEYKAELNTPAPSVAMQLRNAIVDGFRTAFQSFLALVLFLAESAPTLLLWLMILALPAWLLWRRYQRSLVVSSVSGV